MLLLLGNYALDQQQSMQRFGAMMLEGLTSRGIEAELIVPQPVVGHVRLFGGFIQKWLGYIDKYFFFPHQLRKRVRAANQVVVHICDHSNAVYVDNSRPAPVIVTCHDLLAVRGGLGEETDCPATVAGRFLQRWILRGLKKAEAIVCDSEATAADANRLLGESCSRQWVNVVSLGLSYPYHPISHETASARLAEVPSLDLDQPFALHVGSNLRRKNRDAVLRIVATVKDKWKGQIVFAGEALTADLLQFTGRLEIADRVVQVSDLSNELLEALYNRAV